MNLSVLWKTAKGVFGIALISVLVLLSFHQDGAEATRLTYDSSNKPIQALGLSTVQIISYTGTSAAISNAVGSDVVIVRIVCQTDVRIVIAASPTATTSDSMLSAKTVEYFKVIAGSSKVAAIRDNTSGDCSVTEMW